MKKTLLFLFLLGSTFAASAQEKNTSQSYIEQFKENAIALMHQSGIPASIILGVAMHESGCGNSNIARKLNNQFGMKGNTTNVYYKNKKKVRTEYKKYDSIMESFEDFARVLTERKKFSRLSELDPLDYTAWVKGIQRSGYAGSRKWGAQVLAIIEKYKLNLFDSKTDSTTTKLAQAQ
ncbi:flagellum-specific peptidoglycan hydrolase FlgJ [Mucilaginibacter yixingensis]|uniref:Flagellum-specific peptidoglycan hydrolase FlgJ n=1 Tax=Mucilaginibacter yixingensis TaxID=1295612 RepID=A0A2T5JD11_9SPHI|nr:glucosaminidase domain-containing protein [Mucilaginibacter yixingensis]PTQ99646.1 flagellum-specific peptidoglycan hydrolase FlgJ [Mucilaginibacter yixingensis]